MTKLKVSIIVQIFKVHKKSVFQKSYFLIIGKNFAFRNY